MWSGGYLGKPDVWTSSCGVVRPLDFIAVVVVTNDGDIVAGLSEPEDKVHFQVDSAPELIGRLTLLPPMSHCGKDRSFIHVEVACSVDVGMVTTLHQHDIP